MRAKSAILSKPSGIAFTNGEPETVSRADAARADVRPPGERHAAMRWAQRLKRVFGIEVETCAGCGGTMRIKVNRVRRDLLYALQPESL